MGYYETLTGNYEDD